MIDTQVACLLIFDYSNDMYSNYSRFSDGFNVGVSQGIYLLSTVYGYKTMIVIKGID
jgi:hypothetical protein